MVQGLNCTECGKGVCPLPLQNTEATVMTTEPHIQLHVKILLEFGIFIVSVDISNSRG